MAQDKEPSLWQQYLDMRARNVEQLPSFGGEMAALWREARKDINNSLHQVFFGQQAGIGEPGTPLVPTQMQVNQDLNVHGYNALLEDAAVQHSVKGAERGQGLER